MLYQSIRPKTFDAVIGNKQVISSLQKLVSSKKHPHSYLLQGPSGCGKTTIARILVSELGCDPVSVTELNAANTRGLDTIRDIILTANSMPLLGKSKAYIFDESHQLTAAAQQALLKIIEDCPEHTYFIFCTTEPDKIIKTIRNRCAIYSVSSLRKPEMIALLSDVVSMQKYKNISDDILKDIANYADGCPRQGIMLLEQISNLDSEESILAYLKDSVSVQKNVLELCKEILAKRAGKWSKCVDIYKNCDEDTEQIRMAILGYFKKVLLSTNSLEECGRIAEIISIFEKPTYSGGSAALVRMIFESCLV